MPDDLDRAQEINDQLQRDILEAHLRRRVSAESLANCQECEGAIPEKRRLASPGCTRCIECQTEHEQAMKRGSKG
jgi:phage/conjugal plasmid C-4 type zinc finger TraR family protein